MMSASIRRKALSLCSSALKNNGVVQSLKKAQPALAGSRIVPETHLGAPIYSKPLRDVVSSSKADFTTQKWIRAFSTFSESAAGGDIGKRAEQIGTVKVNFDIEKVDSTSGLRRQNSPAFFTASGAVVGSALSTPQATKLGMGSTVSSTFLPNLALFWHINNGIEEILADYVHHEMTRSLILVLMRLFLIVAAKDVFVATN